MRPVVVAAVATGIAAIAVLAIARATGADKVGRAFSDLRPGWIALIAIAELVAYPAYMVAYRSLAQVHGHAPLALPWARAVPGGFGFGLWASSPRHVERVSRSFGRRLPWLVRTREGVGVLRTLLSSPRAYLGAWVGTALYWAADIAAFYGGLRTFGLDPGAGKVILAYATGYAATRRSLPLGGAGITEVLMTYSLYWVRYPLAPALAAVVAYRIFNFLLAATPALIANRQLNLAMGATRPPAEG